MEVEQMTAEWKAEMKAVRDKMDADREERKAERNADREKLLIKLETNQAKTEANH
jgi:hypothetical protein